MIIDSHAHLAHFKFENEFPFLSVNDNGECIRMDGSRNELLDLMKKQGIAAVIEPAISFFSNEKILEFANEYPDYIFAAVGRHPKDCYKDHCLNTKGQLTPVSWKDRAMLEKWVKSNPVAAIGETGLDYHHTQERKHKKLQRKWFIYQIRLAHKYKLPLILHIRKADHDALKLLKRHKRKLHGGVVHCFCGDPDTAQEYIKLGFHLGIGGSLLREEIASKGLRDTVRETPLERLIVETDAPYVQPDQSHFAEDVKTKKLRNSSLLLPLIITEITAVKKQPYDTVEKIVFENTVRIFHLANISR